MIPIDGQDNFINWMELFFEVHEIEGIVVDHTEAIEAYLRAYPEDDGDIE